MFYLWFVFNPTAYFFLCPLHWMPKWALIKIFLACVCVTTYTRNLSCFSLLNKSWQPWRVFLLVLAFFQCVYCLPLLVLESQKQWWISLLVQAKSEEEKIFIAFFGVSWLRKPVIIFLMKHACHNLVAEHWISDLWSWWWEQNKSAKISDILICFHFISSIILAVFNLHIFVKLIARAQVSEDLQFLWIFEPHHPYMLISHAYPSFDCLPLSLSPPLL